MKKKLLFSLLLGSAFSWMNEMYAAEAAAAPAAEEAKAVDKAEAPKAEEEKKYNLKTKGGEDITVTVHQKRDDMVYNTIAINDGSMWLMDTDKARGMMNGELGKNALPFVAGQELPKGYKMINIFFPIDPSGDQKDEGGQNYKVDFSKAIIQDKDALTEYATPAGYAKNEKFLWMLMSGTNEIFIGEMKLDPNAKEFFGDQKIFGTLSKAENTNVRIFELPNEEGTAKLQAALKKAAEGGTGGGASSEELEKLKAELAAAKSSGGGESASVAAVDPSAPLTHTFEFNGMKFVVISTAPEAKAHPKLFEELTTQLMTIFSKKPRVGVAIAATMLKESDSSKVPTMVANIYKEAREGQAEETVRLAAEVQFATETTFEEAFNWVKKMQVRFEEENKAEAAKLAALPVPAEEVARREAEHAEALSKAQAEAEAALAVAQKAQQEAAAALAAAVTTTAQALTEADEKAVAEAKATQEALAAQAKAEQETKEKEATAAALSEAEQNSQALLASAQETISEADAEAARLKESQEKALQAIAALQVDAATLEAEKKAAEDAAAKAEADKREVQQQLGETHNALIQAAAAPADAPAAPVEAPAVHDAAAPADAPAAPAEAPAALADVPAAHVEAPAVHDAAAPVPAPAPVDANAASAVAPAVDHAPAAHDAAPSVPADALAAPVEAPAANNAAVPAPAPVDANAASAVAPAVDHAPAANNAAAPVPAPTAANGAPVTAPATPGSVVPPADLSVSTQAPVASGSVASAPLSKPAARKQQTAGTAIPA